MKNLNLLTLVFIILKLTGTVSWSWLAVLSPTLLGLGLNLLGAVIVFLSGKLK